MSQTRADLDRKLSALEARAHEMSPRQVVARNMPEYFWEKAIGSVLTLAGLKMAWRGFRNRAHHRVRTRAVSAYGAVDC